MSEHPNFDNLLDATADRRIQGWSHFGQVDNDVLTHLISPTLVGGPRWPAMRQAFRVARREGFVLLGSDGLSDPFDPLPDDGTGADTNGLGLELFAVTADPLEQIAGSWLWNMVWEMSQFAAKHGAIVPLLEEMGGLLSTELYDVNIPEEHAKNFVNDDERVGILLGLVAPPMPKEIAGPLSSIRLVTMNLLLLPELDFITEHGEAGRLEIARRLCVGGTPHVSSLRRPSLV